MTNKKVRIAVDAMGGDYAPYEIIKGVHMARRLGDVEILITGPREQITKHFSEDDTKEITIVDAPDVIGMEEKGAQAVRSRPESSLVKAIQLCHIGKADAVVSAGNSGAIMAATLLTWGRIEGIQRPAIAVVIPTPYRPVLLLDAGANTECKPENLRQFALMGHAYARGVLNIKNPSIGLLNIGEEESKGSELTQDAHSLIKQSGVNFFGNVEGKDIPFGKVDVVICDGFTGNVVLKLVEGIAEVFFGEIKSVIYKSFASRTAGLFLMRGLRELKTKLDYEEYGGALLLGVNGICIICHGKSKAKAVSNAISVARNAVLSNIVAEIGESFFSRS